MASKRDRQRRLERARAERRLARQAHEARRRRQIQAGIGGGLALILIVLGTIWAFGGFSPKAPSSAAGGCVWVPKDAAADPNIKDVGVPPASGEPRTGTEPMTIRTNLGDIVATLDLSKAPCAAASFAFLGSKDFFNTSSCTMLSKELEVLQCGDPTSSGAGGPGYQFADEYRPSEPIANPSAPTPTPSSSDGPTGAYYSRGQIVLVNNGENTNGSQFYIVYGDTSTLSAAYTVIGSVTTGMDVVDTVVKAGAVGTDGKPVDQGKPKKSLIIEKLYVGAPPASSAPTSAAPPAPTLPS